MFKIIFYFAFLAILLGTSCQKKPSKTKLSKASQALVKRAKSGKIIPSQEGNKIPQNILLHRAKVKRYKSWRKEDVHRSFMKSRYQRYQTHLSRKAKNLHLLYKKLHHQR